MEPLMELSKEQENENSLCLEQEITQELLNEADGARGAEKNLKEEEEQLEENSRSQKSSAFSIKKWDEDVQETTQGVTSGHQAPATSAKLTGRFSFRAVIQARDSGRILDERDEAGRSTKLLRRSLLMKENPKTKYFLSPSKSPQSQSSGHNPLIQFYDSNILNQFEMFRTLSPHSLDDASDTPIDIQNSILKNGGYNTSNGRNGIA